MNWYGLKVGGEISQVIRWPHNGRPTIFDFNTAIWSAVEYEIVEVEIIER